jgi:hypothetical protein
MLMWHPPQPVAFNLSEASRHAKRGSRQRRAILGNLKARDDGGYMPANSKATLDCLSDLDAAVLFAFTAVESLVNHVIDMLADDAPVTRRKQVVAKQDTTRVLAIDEKYKLVLPAVDGCKAIAGTATWERYRNLKFLRDELLHVRSAAI